MKIITEIIWGFCRLLGYTCQLAALTGLMVLALIAVWRFAGWLME